MQIGIILPRGTERWMNRVIPTIMLALAIGCSGSVASEESDGEWSIEIRTDGGFAGRGTGGVSIRSSGDVEATDFGGATCKAKMTDIEVSTLAGLVRASSPQEWSDEYPAAGADMFHYTLTLVHGAPGDETQAESGWVDGSLEDLPPDLRTLFEEAWRLRSLASSQCSGTSP